MVDLDKQDQVEQAMSEAWPSTQLALSLLVFSSGSSPVLEAMQQWPKSCAVQAAGCVAIRTLVQHGELAVPCPDAVAAVLMQAKCEHSGAQQPLSIL